MSEVKVNKISPRSGTDVTLGDASDVFTLPSSGEIDIASGATLDVNGTIDLTGATKTGFPSNTPRFAAHMGSDSSGHTDATTVKCPMNTESVDSDGAYDPTTNYRFTVPAGEGGFYFIYCNLAAGTSASAFYYGQAKIYKNGSQVVQHSSNDNANYGCNKTMGISSILELSAADYLEIYGYVNTNGGATWGMYSMDATGGASNWGGFKLL